MLPGLESLYVLWGALARAAYKAERKAEWRAILKVDWSELMIRRKIENFLILAIGRI